MNHKLQRLVNFMAAGLPRSRVASALGISESRLSQLLADERVQKAITEREAELASQDLNELDQLKTARTTLLSRVVSLADETDSLREAIQGLQAVDTMINQKERLAKALPTEESTIPVQVPTFIQQTINIQVDSANRIVAIDDRSMAQLPTKEVQRLINEHAHLKDQNAGQASLPAASEGDV